MENKIINKNAEIVNVIKEFKKLISLHSNKIKYLSSYEYYFENTEEDDLDYLKAILFNLIIEFKDFITEYNIKKYKPTIDILKKLTVDLLKQSRSNNEEPTINKDNMSEEPMN